MRLGIIGVGAMGQAIAERLLEKSPWPDMQLIICDRDASKAVMYNGYKNATFTKEISDLVDCDLIIIAVKPQGVTEVLKEVADLKTSTVVSIVAGISLDHLVEHTNTAAVRVMPNTPSLIGEGISALAYSATVSTQAKEYVNMIFTTLGQVVEIDESLFDAVTALSGAGPAYVYLMIEALIDAGCAQGLPRQVAKQLIVSTFIGSAKMLDLSPNHPAVFKDQVTSPGGVTIQALHVMEQRGLRGILWDAVNQGVAKSQELK